MPITTTSVVLPLGCCVFMPIIIPQLPLSGSRVAPNARTTQFVKLNANPGILRPMLYQSLLGWHLAGALITGGVVVTSCIAILRKNSHTPLKKLIQGLALLTCMQLASGSLLWATTGIGSALQLCQRIGAYLAIVSVVEVALLARLKSVERTQSWQLAAIPLGVGIAIVGATLVIF